MPITKYDGTVESYENNREHDFEVEFWYDESNDGIGEYEYWGTPCFDGGKRIIEIGEVYGAWLVRRGSVKTREEVPAVADSCYYRKSFDDWCWTHKREINTDHYAVEIILERFKDRDFD